MIGHPCSSSFRRKRFASVTDADVDSVVAGRTPKSTKNSTKIWVSVLKTFIKKSSLALDLKRCSKDDLCHVCVLGAVLIISGQGKIDERMGKIDERISHLFFLRCI